MNDYVSYALFYLVGLLLGHFVAPEKSAEVLAQLGPITLTALVASLLVPFAAFTRQEGWQCLAVKYGMLPIFGAYTAIVIHVMSVLGGLFFFCAAIVHFGYWMSGIHSRAYRLRQFELGFARLLPLTSRIIAILNGQRRSDLADAIISALLTNNREQLLGALSDAQAHIPKSRTNGATKELEVFFDAE